MTLRLVHRPTRITRPISPAEAEIIAAPPTISDGHVSGLPIQSFLPVIGALSSVIMIVVLRNSNPVFLVIGGLLLVVALIGGLAMALSHRGSASRSRRTQREHYLDFLEKLRARMRAKGRGARCGGSAGSGASRASRAGPRSRSTLGAAPAPCRFLCRTARRR